MTLLRSRVVSDDQQEQSHPPEDEFAIQMATSPMIQTKVAERSRRATRKTRNFTAMRIRSQNKSSLRGLAANPGPTCHLKQADRVSVHALTRLDRLPTRIQLLYRRVQDPVIA
ncbi:hypothetical protein KC332_g9134 [Hortaea werneckii]|uniref:Uncharacterized protein n=2 Tax=Hortaea werneckii TaxID=91943 RepID=A0A3M7HXA0_HORWE|nr:hypothetical protein KC358_g10967 [Hortaea werneckii]OTA38335.1 hypothetical protein BTJ68_01817 [Hortaea werneckii EXF-2000]KAI6827310.1 hypothetical protein KC350_g8322 [Hortaea werneckii]KAI6917462.1 hypothetical protein KC348_g11179 [Hortaea werneckii]KAI6932926.1 hypothetical protein KC341_g8674 [Hortaea werneckii]